MNLFYIENTYNGQNTVTLTSTQSGSPSASSHASSVEYSKDGSSWSSFTLTAGGTNTVSLNSGEKVYFRNSSGKWNYYDSISFHTTFTADHSHIVGGDVRSLINYNNDNVTLSDYGCFYRLFYGNTNLTDASALSLPSTTLKTDCYHDMFRGCTALTVPPELNRGINLAPQCYYQMFYGCTHLTTAPVLRATILAFACYGYMFTNCTALTTAPVLPATTLTESCYTSMFKGCTGLTTAPSLPATTLADYCYKEMFSGCTSLNEVTTYANNISASNCLYEWLNNVANSGTLYNNGSATYTPNSASGIPTGWTEVGPTPSTYTITATAGSNGSISPTGSVSVNAGASQTFTVTPDTGYIVDTLTVDGSTATLTNNTYTFSNVSASHSISVTFKLLDLTDYFYIENTYSGSNTVTLATSQSGTPATGTYATSVQYSKDKNSWTTLTLTAGGTNTITLNQGEKVYFRNDSGFWNYYLTSSNYFETKITANQTHTVGGNINTLLDYTDLNNISLSMGCFNDLFYHDSSMTSASSLSLPSTTLAQNCYKQMFLGCSNLTATPTLPATTLADSCYSNMFNGCTSLTTPPTLPATTLTQSCYAAMFRNCTALTTAPTLPATTLANNCYYQMFNGCTSLNSVTTYADDITATDCITNWLNNVAATGTFNNNGTATYTVDSASGIPVGWTEVKPIDYFYIENTYNGQNTVTLTTTGSGASRASSVEYSKDKSTWTTLTLTSGGTNTITLNQGEKVYFRNDSGKWNSGTFNYTKFTADQSHIAGGNVNTLINYTNLNNITLTQYCFCGLFKGDSNLTSASNLSLPSTTLAQHCYETMFQTCTSLTTAPALPATTLAGNCYNTMFNACTSLTTAPALPATTLSPVCYSNMFDSCRSLTTAPTLPATTLVEYCYNEMFYNCTSLNEVTTYANDISASNCIKNWLFGVSATGTFYNDGEATYPTGVSGIPTGWTEVRPSKTITATAGSNGSISPSGAVTVNVGASQTFTVTPDTGYIVDTLTVDGATATLTNDTYTFSNVQADHTISVTFKLPDLTDYFYIENTYNGQNTVTLSTYQNDTPTAGTYATSVQYSKDKNSWTTLTLTASGTNTITLESGEKVYFRNDSGKWNGLDHTMKYFFTTFTANRTHIVGGNVNTLLDYTNLNNVSLSKGCFSHLFQNSYFLTSAANLSLPSTTLAEYCYYQMFQGCIRLTSTPTLPATALAEFCYNYMFNDCSSLTTAPALPATTLVHHCYYYMFSGCTSLTTAPTLPATTLAESCYSTMFNGCIALTTAPTLPATTLAQSCYTSMFQGCTSLTTAPALPATTLANYCYSNMFYGCTSLNSVTTYANNISASYCLNNWLQNVSNSGTFHNNGSATYTVDSPSGIPVGWTEVLPSKTITATAGSNGSISPSGSVSVNVGSDQTFTFIPDTGYEVDTVTVDGSTVTPTNNTYTFTNVQADHTISVTFKVQTFTLTSSAGQNGSISPSGSTTVNYGSSQTFTFTPDTGYEVDTVTIDGITVASTGNTYTFTNVTADHTIEVTFKVQTFTIMAFGYDHANINPSGTITVNYGASQTFTMAADTGYQISDVLVDGSSVGAVSSYTFTNVTSDHEIAVYGELIPVPTYNCSVTVTTTGGTVMPLSATVDEGQNITFTVTTEVGYMVDKLYDNGTDVTSQMVGNTYTISNVSADHTLSISFVRVVIQYSIVSTAGEGGSISPLGRTYVDEGLSQTYTITPDEGNEIDRLIVDGHEVTPAATYTFENVVSDHTIEASFKETPPPPPPVPDYGLNFDEFENTDYVVQYGTK